MKLVQCITCGEERRETQFSLTKKGGRKEECRFCTYDGLSAEDKADILREAYRNYEAWHYLIMYGDHRGHVPDTLTYHVPKEPGSAELVSVTISFHDLERALENVKIAPRKMEAFELNVLADMPQREAAEIMGITMVSVGQYVKQAMHQLAEWYFADEDTSKDALSGEE